jgi:ATP/maltotriose-dependent transcriptional regulator MalT
MEKISWTNRVRNEEVLHRVKEERHILHTIKRRKANWICHICLLKYVLEGKIEGTGGRGRRHKQLLDDLKVTRRYWNLKEEALDGTLWRTSFGRGYGPVVRLRHWLID